jgi:hypothetical protein
MKQRRAPSFKSSRAAVLHAMRRDPELTLAHLARKIDLPRECLHRWIRDGGGIRHENAEKLVLGVLGYRLTPPVKSARAAQVRGR